MCVEMVLRLALIVSTLVLSSNGRRCWMGWIDGETGVSEWAQRVEKDDLLREYGFFRRRTSVSLRAPGRASAVSWSPSPTEPSSTATTSVRLTEPGTPSFLQSLTLSEPWEK